MRIMKPTFKSFASGFLGLVVLVLTGCEKNDTRVVFEGGTAPILSATTTAVRLTSATEESVAIRFRWTNPDYRLNTGINSADVVYTLELDTLGGNFSSARRFQTTLQGNLDRLFIERELNGILGNDMRLTFGRTYTMQARVTANLNNNPAAARLRSNVINFTATPFAPPPKVPLPTTNQLFIVGNATPGGWNNPVPVPSQQLTQVSPTLYQITLALTGGGSYLILPTNGQWAKYGAIGGNNSNDPFGGEFRQEGGDFLAPPASGNYRMTFDFQTGTFTVVRL